MEETMNEYLKSIGITEIVINRVNELIVQVENITKEKAVDILVTDYVNEDGMRTYEHLRVWTDNNKILIPDFLTESEIRISPIHVRFVSVKISAKDFNYKDPTIPSRIFIEGDTVTGFKVRMKASGINCAHVMEMYQKYYVPYWSRD